VSFYFEADSAYNVVAFTATADRIGSSLFANRPVVPYETITESHPPSEYSLFVAVGYNRMNRVRAHFFHEAKAYGYLLPSYVTSHAIRRGSLNVGENSCVMDATTIEPFATIGNDVIVWSGAHIGHHSSIGDHSFLAPHAAVAGNVHVGERCFLGVNSTVRDGVSIASDCLIGAGTVILSDTSVGEVYASPRTNASSSRSSEYFR